MFVMLLPRNYRILLGAMALAHILFFLTKVERNLSPPITKASPVLKVKTMTEEEWQARQKEKKQIVQTEESDSKERPKDEAFLSEKNNSFEKQTVAEKVDVFNQAAKGHEGQDTSPRQKSARTKGKSLKDIKLSDLGVDSPKWSEAQPESVASNAGLKNGREDSKGISSNNDFVENVKLGDFTHLNTVEYKYYGFFHRIRQKLEQFWGRSIQEKANNLFRSGRRLPASDQYITSLQITLNAKGEIVKVKIQSSSGVRELDDAAIESFNQAGPFPNPPSGLLVNGSATIEWGFVVKS